MSTRDADFGQTIINVIAARAGYRCSFLGCDETTIGPGAGPDDVERKGVAAHIFAASSGSSAPRGTGGLTSEQRSQATNGIWLCQDHSRIIDNDKGVNYPAPKLLAWKALHETKIGRELRKVPFGVAGWFEQVTILSSPIFTGGTTLTLGKVTLIVGENGAGKSALCEWLSSGSRDAEDLWRWSSERKDSDISFCLTLIAPERVEALVKFSGYRLLVEYNGRRSIDLSNLLKVVYIKDHFPRLIDEKFEDDVEYLARVWQINPFQVFGVVERLCNPKFGPIRSAVFRPEEADSDDVEEAVEVPEHILERRHDRPALTLWITTELHEFELSFKGISGGERTIFIIAGALVIADDYSAFHTVLLLMDLGANLDDSNLTKYAERLQSSDFQFQTILVSPTSRPRVDWTGWSIARLIGRSPDVHFEQNMVQDMH